MQGKFRLESFVWPVALFVAFGIVSLSPPSRSDAFPSSAGLSVPTSTDSIAPIATSTTLAEAVNSALDIPAASASTTVVHVPLPDEVRGIYWTASTAGSSRADELMSYMKAHGLNTAVIDLKMDDGEVAFAPHDASLKEYVEPHPAIRDLDALLTKLHDKGIYRIARIFIMRDGSFGAVHPEYALQKKGGGMWRDKTGTPWLDPAVPAVADYAVALAKEAYARGFDEVQFDYVRFPSDGALTGIVYPVYDGKKSKVTVMQEFFDRVGGAMKDAHIPVSFDLFGMTFWNTDDFGIGQRLEDVHPLADFVSPMAYPSHYPPNFEGFKNPALYPYEIIKRTLDEGAKMLESQDASLKSEDKGLRLTFRPWIQDFDIGAVYTASLIEAEIKATRDAGASGFLIWNARNVYEPANYLK